MLPAYATIKRTKTPKQERMRNAVLNLDIIKRERCLRSFHYFIKEFWSEVASDEYQDNWHIKYLCDELSILALRVSQRQPKEYDLIINVPPGSTKSITCSVMFPIWCWTKWHWMRFICASYSGALSLAQAEYSRDILRSDKFHRLFPELEIKLDQDTKSNYRIIKREYSLHTGELLATIPGGNRYSTSVGGTLTGFHGHILIVDDPLNPQQAVSDQELKNTNYWIEQTLSTRKVDKAVTPTVLIMQRLHQDDPSGHILNKKKKKIKHICLPGEIINYSKEVQPAELLNMYKDGYLDPVRLGGDVLAELESDLGQYGYAGQVGQKPTPPGGGMFQVDRFQIIDRLPADSLFIQQVRYWDKAGSQDSGAYTCGTKMARLKTDKYVIIDVKRGQWRAEIREQIMKDRADADGRQTVIYHEQEPGSGGKESAEATITSLAGFASYADRPTGDKVFRADPYSVQVNNGNVMLLRGEWNNAFIEEHRYFPFSTHKDQVDSAAGAFNKLRAKRIARVIR